MTDTTLFDIDELYTGSGPRVRATDRLTSHIAADKSQAGLHETKNRILELVGMNGPLVGTQLNALYRKATTHRGWRVVGWDTPRKRAGELAVDGYLDDSDTRIAAGNHLPETIYRLTAKGRRVLDA